MSDLPYEPPKWALDPHATLREIARQEEDPGYGKTICGVHRMIWCLINVDLNGYIPQNVLDDLNDLMEIAYRMGKRMDYRLREYFKERNGITPEEALTESARGKFVEEVKNYPNPIKDATKPSWKDKHMACDGKKKTASAKDGSKKGKGLAPKVPNKGSK